MSPVGLPLVAGWYLSPALFPLNMLPGGMLRTNISGIFIMIIPGWFAFLGNPPL